MKNWAVSRFEAQPQGPLLSYVAAGHRSDLLSEKSRQLSFSCLCRVQRLLSETKKPKGSLSDNVLIKAPAILLN